MKLWIQVPDGEPLRRDNISSFRIEAGTLLLMQDGTDLPGVPDGEQLMEAYSQIGWVSLVVEEI